LIVLSEKEVSDAEDIKMAKMALRKIEVGEVYDGVVTNVMNFGCFVAIQTSLGKGKKVTVEGLVHISEISWDKVDNISNVCGEGKNVKVKVIGVEGNKLSLSIKKAQDDPWLKADKKYKVDSKHKGVVVKLSDFGAFVALEPGIEGLIHMTKIPPGNKLDKGQEINIYVEEINSKAKKLSLGLVLTAKPVGYK
jgi:small subunit ribosomal protein S1